MFSSSSLASSSSLPFLFLFFLLSYSPSSFKSFCFLFSPCLSSSLHVLDSELLLFPFFLFLDDFLVSLSSAPFSVDISDEDFLSLESPLLTSVEVFWSP